jgi:hypothetical protein
VTTRAIRALLDRAADEYAEMATVTADTAMALAAEGYDLSKLEEDCERTLSSRPSAEVVAFPVADEIVG